MATRDGLGIDGARATKLALLSAVLTLSAAPALAQWSEPGGPWNTRTAEGVTAPLTAPTEVWRIDVDDVLSEPVASGGIVYVAVRDGRTSELRMLDAATGEELTSTKLPTSDHTWVSVLGSAVVAVTDEALHYYERRGEKLRRGKVVRGEFASAASLMPGLAAVHSGEELLVVELRSGKTLASAEGLPAKPLVLREPTSARIQVPSLGDKLRTRTPGDRGWVTGLQTLTVEGMGSREPAFRRAVIGEERVIFSASREQDPEIIGIGGADARGAMIASTMRVRTASAGTTLRYLFLGGVRSRSLPIVDRDVCVMDGVVFGRDRAGDLVMHALSELPAGILTVDKRPDGAKDGPISSAGGVLLMGNWAFDVEARRILWVAPHLEPAGVLVPVTDGTCVFEDGSGDLVAVSAEAPATVSDVGIGLTASERPTMPGGAAAVVLRDGSRHVGVGAEAPDGSVEFTPEGADEPVTIERRDVAGVEFADGSVMVTGPSYPFSLATKDALDRAHADGLADVFTTYARRDLVAEAKRVLAESREFGLPDSTARDLGEMLASRTESVKGNRDKQLAKAQELEVEERRASFDRALKASQWLAGQGLALEASDVLAHARRYWNGPMPNDARKALEVRASLLIPGAFPFTGRGRAMAWLEWASELAPAGGTFFDLIEKGRLKTPWDENTIGIRTANIELLSRTDDPKIVGACLRHGEGAVRVLQDLLEEPSVATDERLEVRIHRSRKDYLAEDLDGFQPATWTLGFYSPMHRVSRFHVPDPKTALNENRQLHEVVAHELTHQFIDERWKRAGEGVRRTPIVPGYWMVEGFARFIEDQSLEAGRRGAGFDDPTVQSVESAAALMGRGGGLRVVSLIRATQLEFSRLKSDEIGTVELKSTLVRIRHTQQSAFYDQAGALVFFLMNHRGEEGRNAFIETLAAHYRGETERDLWKNLGFKTSKSLEREFEAFLNSL